MSLLKSARLLVDVYYNAPADRGLLLDTLNQRYPEVPRDELTAALDTAIAKKAADDDELRRLSDIEAQQSVEAEHDTSTTMHRRTE